MLWRLLHVYLHLFVLLQVTRLTIRLNFSSSESSDTSAINPNLSAKVLVTLTVARHHPYPETPLMHSNESLQNCFQLDMNWAFPYPKLDILLSFSPVSAAIYNWYLTLLVQFPLCELTWNYPNHLLISVFENLSETLPNFRVLTTKVALVDTSVGLLAAVEEENISILTNLTHT